MLDDMTVLQGQECLLVRHIVLIVGILAVAHQKVVGVHIHTVQPLRVLLAADHVEVKLRPDILDDVHGNIDVVQHFGDTHDGAAGWWELTPMQL